MTDVLVVIVGRGIMGEIRRDRRGRLTFVYDEGWRASRNDFQPRFPRSPRNILWITRSSTEWLNSSPRGLNIAPDL